MDDLPAGDLNNGGVQLQIPESELLLQQVSSPVVEKVASQDNIFWHTSPPLEKLKALAMLKQKENVPSPNTEISCLMNMLAQKASPMNTMDTGDIGIGSSAGQYSSDRKRRMCRDQTPLNTKNSFKDAFPSPFCISTPLHSKGISHTEKKKKLDKTPQIPGSNTSDDICSKAKLLDLVNSINTIFQSESLEGSHTHQLLGNHHNREHTSKILDNSSPILVPLYNQKHSRQLHTSSPNINCRKLIVLNVLDTNIDLYTPEKILEALELKSSEVFTILLHGDWVYSEVHSGDYISVHGTLTKNEPIIIDNDKNLLIVDPDTLVSATPLADSFSCMRRSVLQEKARLSNDKTTSLTNGNMLHQLFQICLRTMDFSTAFIQHNIDTIISRHILDLFEIGVSEAIAKQTLSDSIRNIQKWAAEFIQTKESKRASPHSKKEKVQIKEVLDIEETIWSPKFGIKGNIDASITIMRESSDDLETMPLELKTGLSTMANSHKAQTIIYTQLMKDRYATNTTAGLLVYLKSGETQIVPASRNELRGILMQRNALARYLRSENGTLPPLQENKYSCQKCFALNSCMMYHKFYEEGTEDLKELLPSFREKTGHLTDRHRSFFVKWEKVLEIESRYMQQTRRELWTLCGEEREKLGRCLSAMMVADCIEHPTWESKGSRYTYSFQRPQQPSGSKATASLLNSNINVGEPIVISSEEDDSYALASGFVLEIAPGTIKVIVDRKINKDHHDDTKRYRIDKDDLTGGLSRLRGNLINLLVSEQDEHKRSLIIDLERPIFESYNSANALVRTDSTFNLNDDQIRAINKVACAKDYALILGMPGTGKTTTIAALVQHLLKLGKSILLTAYTHSAIDNVLLKLKASGVRFLRFGNKSKIHPDIRDVAFDPFKFKSVADLKHSLAEQKLIATTCLGVDGPIVSSFKYDFCIIDEASQLSLPACIGPLKLARTFVLVGDSYQLPPLFRSDSTNIPNFHLSLFRLLSEAHPESLISLHFQYRMCADVMKLCNKLVYGGKLRCGNLEVSEQVLHIPQPKASSRYLHDKLKGFSTWLEEIFDPSRRVVFIDTSETPGLECRTGDALQNQVEAYVVQYIVESLISGGILGSKIGVVSPYRSQLKQISYLLEASLNVEILTVDQFQGRDKDCIILSLVRSNSKRNVGDLLRDWRRINVAFSRAKSKLILIGCRQTLSGAYVFREFFDLMSSENWILRMPSAVISTLKRERS